ncbi:uncharacterized protein LOC108451316 [Gossypium arboreum]|uniref:uncharacterized protein LOC108451316 n=1 Tax=Gossypium arboreum TaxID=29729 RepID=UPI00081923D1|nr:uncharacterized protein LOC108451316 [Gossypium arboreum]
MELHHHFSHEHSGCGELVSGLSYNCTECEFYLDKKCFEASPELDLHVKCALFSKTIAENKIGELEGVSKKDLLVSSENGSKELLEETNCFAFDEKCILLQPIIERFPRHGHRISHTFIHRQHEIKSWKCRICYEEVNSKHGCYCCSDCNYIVHTNCGVKDYSWYDLVDDELEETSELLNNSAFVVIRETKLGENDVKPTEIKHLSHPHNLIFSNDVKDDKYCDGCVLFISTSVYHCAQCDILLHKSCAELPKKMYIWRHIHQRPFTLNLHAYFLCCVCAFRFNNCFSYDCNVCENRYCVEHRLFYYKKYEGQCNGCGRNLEYAFACKECNFFVEYGCLTLPDKIQHKCDEHPLMLTYGEDNIYSKYHYCDICEKEEIQAIGFTAVQFVTIQPMKIVFLMHTRI